MIICSSSNIDLIQGVSGYGTAADGATDWRIENTATGVFNILNSPNLLAPNVSIIDAGNVGVGTIPVSDTNKLQVQGNLNVSADTLSKTYTATNTTAGTNDILTMRYDTTNGLRFQQTLVAANDVRYDVIQKTNNVDYTSPVISFYKGNVGIGTATIQSSYKLQVQGNAWVENQLVFNNGFSGGSGGNGGAEYACNKISFYGSANTPTTTAVHGFGAGVGFLDYYAGVDSGHRWYTGTTGGTGYGKERMRISSTGNLGIGTVNPFSTLHLHANDVTTDVRMILSDNTSTASGTRGFQMIKSSANEAQIINYENTPLTFSTSNVERMRISSTGYIGIGTNAPFSMLHLHANDVTTDVRMILSDNTSTASASRGFQIIKGGSNEAHIINYENTYLRIATNGTERMRITNTGNVGIGTISPFSMLHLHANATSTDVRMILSDNTSTASASRGFQMIKSTANEARIINYESTSMRFSTNATERMCITSTGNVGIGTNAPFSLLHLHANAATTDVRMILSDNTSTASATRGFQIIKGTGNEAHIINYENTYLRFGTNGTERMRITDTGNVGIGTNAPECVLEVGGTSGVTSTITENRTFFQFGSSSLGTSTSSWSVTMKVNGRIWTTAAFLVSSDSRIKEDIQDINDDGALQMILTIEPKTYKYIDKIERGEQKVYGFIAQQVRDVIPEIVTIQKSYIPNIMLLADYDNKIITLPSQPTKVIIKMNDKIKCYDKDNKEILVEVIEVIDDLTFKIKEIEYSDSKIFVYGTFVDDFHTLNKDYIFTLNVCATQELHRRIEAQKVVIKSHEDRIKELETKMERLLSGTT